MNKLSLLSVLLFSSFLLSTIHASQYYGPAAASSFDESVARELMVRAQKYAQEDVDNYNKAFAAAKQKTTAREKSAAALDALIKKEDQRQQELDESLIRAAKEQDGKKMLTLLKQGAKAHYKNRSGQTPLMIFCAQSFINADQNVHNGDQNPIGDPTSMVIKSLLEGGADLTARNMMGWTPLVVAANFGRYPVVEALLKQHPNFSKEELEAARNRVANNLAPNGVFQVKKLEIFMSIDGLLAAQLEKITAQNK